MYLDISLDQKRPWNNHSQREQKWPEEYCGAFIIFWQILWAKV